MCALILVKHSLPEIKQDVPPSQWKLGMEGRRRARDLAELLAKYAPQAVISSNEPKAVETAERVAEHFGLQNRVVEGLNEHERARVGWLARHDLETRIAEFFRKPDEMVLGSETANAARERFTAALEQIENEAGDVTAIVVTHGTVMSLYLEKLMQEDGFGIWKRLGLPSFVVIEQGRVVEFCDEVN